MVEEPGQVNSPPPVEAPRGTLNGRVDEKGRLKLPAAVAQYLEKLGERKVFITTLNLSTALIYPISIWKETEKLLQEAGEDADSRSDVAMIANHYGEDVEVDGQGTSAGSDDLTARFGIRKRRRLSALLQGAD